MFDDLQDAFNRLFRPLPAAPGVDERRTHLRYQRPWLTLTIEGRRYRTLDWSLGGFRIPDFHRDLVRGERLAGQVGSIGWTPAGDFVAEVAHCRNGEGAGLRIIEITPATFLAMGGLKAS